MGYKEGREKGGGGGGGGTGRRRVRGRQQKCNCSDQQTMPTEATHVNKMTKEEDVKTVIGMR